jgi:hypothetical protein
VAWNGFRESPWFGQGLGYSIPIASWSIMASDTDLFMVHDFYLYVLLKFGMLGVWWPRPSKQRRTRPASPPCLRTKLPPVGAIKFSPLQWSLGSPS